MKIAPQLRILPTLRYANCTANSQLMMLWHSTPDSTHSCFTRDIENVINVKSNYNLLVIGTQRFLCMIWQYYHDKTVSSPGRFPALVQPQKPGIIKCVFLLSNTFSYHNQITVLVFISAYFPMFISPTNTCSVTISMVRGHFLSKSRQVRLR